jgi:hypothetical protein
MITAETTIFPIVDMDFVDMDFPFSSVDNASRDARHRCARGRSARAQPFPKTEPGLAGETGASGACGTVYESDGLKVGAMGEV